MEGVKHLEREFIIITLLFFAYSFIGWLWETVYCSIKAKKFVYRGFLIGPITPIYGFGIIGVLYFIEPFSNHLSYLYLFSVLLVTVLEYVTSYLLEKLFHATLWDYKQVPLNINGRVAVPVSLFWGIGCLLIVYFIQPKLMGVVDNLALQFGIFLPVVLLMIIMLDLGYTLANVPAFTNAVQEMGEVINQRKLELKEEVANKTESLSSKQKQLQTGVDETLINRELSRTKSRLNWAQHRILQSFPNMKLSEGLDIESIRHLEKIIRKQRKEK